MIRHVFITGILGMLITTVNAAPKIVPKPVSYEKADGQFTINAKTKIVYGRIGRQQAELAASFLRPATGFALKVVKSANPAAEANAIALAKTADADMPKEGYTLSASEKNVVIAAQNGGGLAFGVQTLRQLLPADIFSPKQETVDWTVEGCAIADYPGFPWRGMMLDVSRYWYTKEFMLRYIDLMALHKMSVLHWHVVDDAGWRIEIKKYPKLTEVGAFRGKGDKEYGGFYTQDDVREIVQYARDRGITIVPEIEIPAHTLAALVAYPHLSCHGRQLEMPTRCFISKDLYCPGKKETWTFLEDVMDEVCDLFPGTYIHIGGDEAKYDNWAACKDCQALMKKEGIEDLHHLHGYMNLRMEEYLQGKGRQIIGWDEILKCGVSPKAGIMIWRNWAAAAKGAERGNLVVASPTKSCYFDATESRHPGEPPGTLWIPSVPLKNAYDWHPIPDNVSEAAAKNFGGGNGCVWSDQFLHKPGILPDKPGQGTRHSESYIEYMSLPRMAALAEVNWTPRGQRDFDDFQERMKDQYVRYLHQDYNFRLPLPELTVEQQDDGSAKVSAKGHITGGRIRYATDGKNPTATSPVLNGTITVEDMDRFRAATFSADGKKQSLVTMSLDLPGWIRKMGSKIGEWKAGQLTEEPQVHTFDGTGIVGADGPFALILVQPQGVADIMVHSVEVYRNDDDKVYGKARETVVKADKKGGTVPVWINGYETGATFKFKVTMSAAGGADSEGYVLLRSGK